MAIYRSSPEDAWRDHIAAAATQPGWLEDSAKISDDIGLSKRELFGLILLCHIRRCQFDNNDWHVGFDLDGTEPNDGFVSNEMKTTLVEHKIVPQMAPQDVLDGILSTYAKYAKRGAAYGGERTLIIYANKAARGMVEVSSLRDQIQDQCPFDQVLLMNCVAMNGNETAIIHITSHYPKMNIAQIDFNIQTGIATVPHCELAVV
ncbi:hypothetical protein OAK85_04915 [Mariniblastus sp.]|nr:hypothetical protein [Mariniblastus sp.]